jgi:hypothetical protein
MLDKIKLKTMNLKSKTTEEIINLYSSNFTEGFLRILGEMNLDVTVEKPNVSKIFRKKRVSPFNKLKNPILREKLANSNESTFNPNNHVSIKELGYKSIYEMDKMSREFWSKYFSKYSVYLNKGVSKNKLSGRILFDKGIVELLIKKNPVPR